MCNCPAYASWPRAWTRYPEHSPSHNHSLPPMSPLQRPNPSVHHLTDALHVGQLTVLFSCVAQGFQSTCRRHDQCDKLSHLGGTLHGSAGRPPPQLLREGASICIVAPLHLAKQQFEQPTWKVTSDSQVGYVEQVQGEALGPQVRIWNCSETVLKPIKRDIALSSWVLLSRCQWSRRCLRQRASAEASRILGGCTRHRQQHPFLQPPVTNIVCCKLGEGVNSKSLEKHNKLWSTRLPLLPASLRWSRALLC